jgi:molybdenum cofactor biosynthesis protein MoaC
MTEEIEGRGMFDVSDKPDTLRFATAQAVIRLDSATMILVKEGKSPKGNIVDAARISATMAAKRTWELIPYCHPIPIDHIKVDVLLKEESIEIIAEIKSIWKTGVEMESLTAVSIAALTIYDMLKPVDNSLIIESVRLLNKSGGIKDFYERFDKKLRSAVLVISDSVSRGERVDRSGKLVIDRLIKNGLEIVENLVIPDDVDLIESNLNRLCNELKVDLIVTSGGTGIGHHDVTPEATMKVIEKELIGVAETLRAHGQRRTPLSMLSRGIAGVRGNTIIINLPGSVKAVSESLDSLFPGILHMFNMLKGHGH